MARILICDDEKDIVSALRIYLEAEGYETLSAANGKEALALLAENTVHLVLLDIMMPEMDDEALPAARSEKLKQICQVPLDFSALSCKIIKSKLMFFRRI